MMRTRGLTRFSTWIVAAPSITGIIMSISTRWMLRWCLA
jgi:hypothetical protein